MKSDNYKNTILLIKDFFKNRNINIVKFYLFGSRARNDAKETSDYDFFLVLDKDFSGSQKREITAELYRFLARKQALINLDLIIKSELHFEIERNKLGALAYNVNIEGILQ